MHVSRALLCQFILQAVFYTLQAAPNFDVIVKTEQGIMQGITRHTASDTKYYSFLGIPYAQPPIGQHRFLPPIEPHSWIGIMLCASFSSQCWQLGSGGSEDCLFLNVHTPQLPANESNLLPVMVWIHGGGFTSGNGNIDPGHMIDENVVVVSINYRLNVFGFLSLEGTDVTGNMGLKDQVAALKWVQKYISSFGGDPNKVMILGGSAGGASVHYHMLSPMSAGLFVAADAESGSALNPWAFHTNTEEYAFRLAAVLGNATDNGTEVLDFFNLFFEEEIGAAVAEILTEEEMTRVSAPFVPTLEFPHENQTQFLPDTPLALMQSGNFNKVTFLTGVTISEGISFVGNMSDPAYWEGINEDLEVYLVPVDLGLTKGSSESLEVADMVKTFYFGDQNISIDTQQQWVDLRTDLLFATGVQTGVHQMSQWSSDIYNYQFAYNNAAHAVEGNYLFYGGDLSDENDSTVKVVKSMVTFWLNTLREGSPGTDQGVTWSPVTDSSYPFLKIDETFSTDENLENDRMNFWFNIYATYSNDTNSMDVDFV